MANENTLKLNEIAGARGELHALAAEVETVKLQLDRLAKKAPSRAYLCRTVLMATSTIWALVGGIALYILR